MRRIGPLALGLILVSGCVTAPRPADPGTYHAVGTEPGWTLDIDAASMRFSGPYGQGPVAEPTPRVIIGFAGEIYQGHRIKVNIVHGRCSDGMSDRVYRDKVQLGVDGKSYEGCGGGTDAQRQ